MKKVNFKRVYLEFRSAYVGRENIGALNVSGGVE